MGTRGPLTVGELPVNSASVLHIAGQSIYLVIELAGPMLITALGVGVLISLFQTITQIQEPTLTFLPKLLAVGLVIFISGNWMIGQLESFTFQLFAQIPSLLAGR